MAYTHEVFTENSPMSFGPSVPIKLPITRKLLCQFSETLDVKPKTDLFRSCATKSKRKKIRVVSMLWSSIEKRHDHTQINDFVKISLDNWILYHPQVLVSTIANDYFKLSIDDQIGPQLVPKVLFKVSLVEIHNIMVSTPEEGILN